ncbi:hypothetical protein FD33_GL001808 [Companilactobacillus paralimentarius DSM 13238 = JCM 10415]|jgi:hypothetical protein|uniref:Uncharacterized protein n=3 Tax=Companilactobacillus TaxID=2767879 RepID=A0A202FG82_9LACO|nr:MULTISPECIES: hypothetical protein [Companilactobacillus]KAE9564162.1 hypothetical protein ATN96_09125 [Companilactobacillus paralimentarius]KRK82844.1 hypothetical protein FC78_GL001647 [Companilactobacillus bobalius DSM 19674]KRL31664.1 hypothetical protein FD33_GL001808 [Companilactobacillus paralimentarius DSM 13238 = JCM 10415]MDR4933683.1 hypothetical protein [Companilactobacillus paralimentarius]OVE99474.1 hypothetical protein LKACC16343_00586 [Companilactobacillus bobalius]
MRNNQKKFNEIYQSLLRKIVMFGVLSMLLMASARITGWIIMEYAGFASAIYTIVLIGMLIYILIIKTKDKNN